MSESHAIVTADQLLAHRPWVRALARSLVRDESRADDVEQEVWLSALRRPPRHGAGLRGWLRALVRSRAADTRRGDTRRAAHERAAPARGPAAGTGELVERVETHRRLVTAVSELAEPYRSTVLLRFYEDLPPREVAARMGVPVETVRTRLRRAQAKLRDRLRDEHGGDDRACALALLLLAGGRPARAAARLTTAALLAGAAAVVGVVAWSLVASSGDAPSSGPERPAPGGRTELAAAPVPAGGPEEGPAAAGDEGPEDRPAPAPVATREVRVRDLADGSSVPDVRLVVRVSGEAAAREATSGPAGVAALPAEGLRSVRPGAGPWLMPAQTAEEVLATGELWLYRSAVVTGTVRAADESDPLNPTAVALRLDLSPAGAIQDEPPWNPVWMRRHRLECRELNRPLIDGTFRVRAPRIRGAALLAGATGWITEGAWLPAGDEGRIDFVMRRAPRITGTLRHEDGAPAAGADLSVCVTETISAQEFRERPFPRSPGAGVAVIASADRAIVTRCLSVTTDEEGAFALGLEVPGEVFLFDGPSPGCRPLFARLGRVERDRAAVELTVERLRREPEVQLLLKGKPLSGTVELSMLPEPGVRFFFKVTLDREGRMPADLLEPGWLYDVRFRGGSRLLDWRGDERVVELTKLLDGTMLTEALERREARAGGEEEEWR